jgi:hypothetical protein
MQNNIFIWASEDKSTKSDHDDVAGTWNFSFMTHSPSYIYVCQKSYNSFFIYQIKICHSLTVFRLTP